MLNILQVTEHYNNYSTKLGTTLKEKKRLKQNFYCIITVIKKIKVAT
jgi:hypothetical protein